MTNSWDGFARLGSSSSNMGGTARTIGSLYDRNGNRIRVTHPDGLAFNYAEFITGAESARRTCGHR